MSRYVRKVNMKCYLCGDSVRKVTYAIRDMIPNESYRHWVWRHILGYLGKPRKRTVILPVCEKCVFDIQRGE